MFQCKYFHRQQLWGYMGNQAMRSGMLIIAGMAIVGLIDNFVGLILRDASIWQFHAFRTLIGLPVLVVAALILGQSTRLKRPLYVAGRSLVLAISMFLYFGSLPLMPIAQAGAGLFTAPIWVMVFSALLFRQRIGPRRLFAVVLGSLGVIAIMRPEAANFSPLTFMPIAAGAFYALANLMARHWCAEEPTLGVLAGSFSALGLIGAAILIATTLINQPIDLTDTAAFLTMGYQAPTQTFWIWTIIQALGSLLAVGLMTRAYQSADTSYVTIFEYSFLLIASFWGWQLNDQSIELRDILGMGLVILAGVVVAISTERRASTA